MQCPKCDAEFTRPQWQRSPLCANCRKKYHREYRQRPGVKEKLNASAREQYRQKTEEKRQERKAKYKPGQCTKCGKNFKPTESQVRFRKYHRCDDCRRKYQREYRQRPEVRPRILAAYKQWCQSKNGKTFTEQYRKSSKYKDWFRQYSRQYKNLPKQKPKVEARHILQRQVKSGKLKRLPCIRCGNPQSEGHHEDYNKPLSVLWLCATCHKLEHRQ